MKLKAIKSIIMKSIKKYIVAISFLCFIIACNDKNKEANLINIKFDSFEIVLNSEISTTPFYYLKFSIENLNKEQSNFFCAKSYKKDTKIHSRLYLLDTVKNQMIEIYSNSRPIIEKGDKQDIYASINLYENKEYFKLNDSFFNENNFNVEPLNNLFLKSLNNSIIFYQQDERDLNGFIIDISKPNLLQKNTMTIISKPKKITKKWYGIKKKELKIININ
jgi:hypothetical protein